MRLPLKLCLCAALLLLIAVLAIGEWILSVRDRKWAALEARVDALAREFDAPPLERLPLGRRLLPGNAWDDYVEAEASPPDKGMRIFNPIFHWLRRDSKAKPSEAEALMAEFSPRIDLIRKGAWRQSAKPPTPAYSGNGIHYPVFQWYGSTTLALLCVGKARLLAEGGAPSEALQLLVDVCLYGRDVAGSRRAGGAFDGVCVMRTAFHEMLDLLQRHKPSEEDLAALDQALSLLDDQFPDRANDLRCALFEFGNASRQEDRSGVYSGHAGRRWRYCFSRRLQAAATFFETESNMERMIAFDSQPWSVARTVSRSQLHTLVRGELRLLRVATRYLAQGTVAELDDPVGGSIRTRLSDRSLLIWKRPLFGADWEAEKGESGYGFVLAIEVPRRRP